MTESYCGKSCEACQLRSALNCPGCKDGPGHKYQGECELAKCIIGKGHENCLTCRYCDGCGIRKRQDTMAQERLEKQQARARQAQVISEKAPFLITWLNRLFILALVAVVADVLQLFTIVETVGTILEIAATVGLIVCLFALCKEDDHYRWAGIARTLACAISLVTLGANLLGWSSGIFTVISWVGTIAMLVGIYMEFTGHSYALVGADDGLSDKWEKLWGIYIGMYVSLFVCLLIAMFFVTFGVLLMFAVTIALLVVGIVRLVYLRQSIAVFRSYREREENHV